MSQRGLSEDDIDAAFTYGREVRTRGAVIYAIGKKEVRKHLVVGVDLRTFEGIQVVCVSDGTILTVYKGSTSVAAHSEAAATHFAVRP